MINISCKINVWSSDHHIQDLLTGFAMLNRSGAIDLEQVISPAPARNSNLPQHLIDAWKTHLQVIVNGNRMLYYDCHDGFELDEKGVEEADFYFKRTYSESAHGRIDNVYPMGLYHPVYPDFFDRFTLQRSLSFSPGIHKLTRALYTFDRHNRIHFSPKVSMFGHPPELELPPKVIFMARTWDPEDDRERLPDKKDERRAINEMRTQIIRLLKKEFGPDFVGGLAHTEYAIRHFKDCLLTKPDDAKWRHYFSLLKSIPICIATKGLHGSVGAKFAEYVALGKAIVSEPLGVRVVGDFDKGRNYLEFTTPDGCIQRARELYDNPDKRAEMMTQNIIYYEKYQKPDALIYNTLLKAIDGF